MNLPSHGSNPQYVYEALKLKQPDKIVDFSVNTNPLGPPDFLKDQWGALFELVTDYPDPLASELRSVIADKEGLNIDQVLSGNGAAELIFLVASLFHGKKALIVSPAFSEYEQALLSYGCEVEEYILEEKNGWQLDPPVLLKALKGKDLVVICNPNNPTGIMYDKNHILEVISYAKDQKTLVMIDEAFYDFAENSPTLAAELPNYQNLIILRSLTKMYAIAGVRLGYVLGNRDLIHKLEDRKPHWSVNSLAQQLGIRCLHEANHVRKTQQFIKAERERVQSSLHSLSYSVLKSNVNFFLVKDLHQHRTDQLYQFLLSKGIVTRHTRNFKGLEGSHLRMAVKTREENDRMLEQMKEWRGEC
ncbi:threonine-phosphate decarboxylase CobD [Metabacillus arenae]|uniref:threonine-phosphate decarboxylase n=1 Tax=Metabacillus arenae TaxID=2771434 RepID=A0A926RZ52_9BACI|nr:threonine-phosphate decarboxylase CobD [Metabacillus arenae]MBD1378709.1 threonine-phosphate decarboxylase [Metabacillus arenae]